MPCSTPTNRRRSGRLNRFHRYESRGFRVADRYRRRREHGPDPEPPAYGYLDFLADLAGGQRSDLALATLLGGLGLGLVVAGPILFAWSLSEILRATGRAFRNNRNRKALRNQAWIRRRLRRINRNLREPPTAELLMSQWSASRSSLEGKILLGVLLGDLESVVDNAYIRDETGEIVGRKPGIRGWLDLNCPALSKHYKTLMRYKAFADKMKLFSSSEFSVVPTGSFDAKRPEQERQQEPEAGSSPAADLAARFHPNEKRIRTVLKQYRTFADLDDAIWSSLGLIRKRQRTRRMAS